MNETTHFLGVVRCLRCGIVEPLVSRLVGPQCSLKIFEVGPMTLIPQDSRLTCNQVCSVFFGWGIEGSCDVTMMDFEVLHPCTTGNKCNIWMQHIWSRNYWTTRGVFLFCMALVSSFTLYWETTNGWTGWYHGHFKQQLPLSPPARPSEVEREDGGAGAVDGQKIS